MRNIRKFETFEDFLASQESVSGSGKYVQDIKPGFVYVKERYEDGTYAFYNGEDREEYEFGDVIYYDGTPKLKKAYYSAFTPSMGEKVGLVVVPTALSPDGNARIMAFGSITTEMREAPAQQAMASEPEAEDVLLGEAVPGPGGEALFSKVYAEWHGDMADENQTVYTCVPGFHLRGGSSPQEGTIAASAPGSEDQTSYYEEPLLLSSSSGMSRFSSDANFMYPNPHTNGEYYNTANTIVAISPFLGDSLKEQDPAYLQEELAGGSVGPIRAASPVLGARKDSLGGGNYNAFSDFSGYTWTYGCPPAYGGELNSASPSLKSSKPVSGVLGAYFPHDYVRQFYTDGTQRGDWYLPSMGEMGFVVARYRKIFEILQYLHSVGAIAEDGTDNAPGLPRPNHQAAIWTSTVGAKRMLGASSSGYGAYPKNRLEGETLLGGIVGPMVSLSPVVVVSSFIESFGNGHAAQSLKASHEQQFNLYFKLAGITSEGNEILPFAMINEGKIQRTMGDYTVANGHQMKDFYQH